MNIKVSGNSVTLYKRPHKPSTIKKIMVPQNQKSGRLSHQQSSRKTPQYNLTHVNPSNLPNRQDNCSNRTIKATESL